MKILAVDLGGTHATCALVEGTRILARETVSLSESASLRAAFVAIHSFDPELLVYGGGVMKSANAILPFLQEYVQKNAWTPWGTVGVRAAQLGNDAALLGVVPLFEQELSFVR